MNELELRTLKTLLEEVWDLCKKGAHGSAMKKVTIQIQPLLWEKVEEKLKPPATNPGKSPR